MNLPTSAVALIMRDGLVLTATRRGMDDNYALIGGSMEPGESCQAAMVREVREETGIEVLASHFVFERVDSIGGDVAWCFKVTEFAGEPRTMEEGIRISWQRPEALLDERCTFREYNRQLFKHLGIL